ncbi:hypothetical protein SRRS_12730 [Sporomusa rhizae]|uniref:CAP domain-containing protein n=1 Tax=Sporomusa rhizae TaxID=357999 RepID=UPI00352B471C
MTKFRTVTAAVLTALVIGSATVPVEAASTLYYANDQQLNYYQQINQWLISKGYTPYNLVKQPSTTTPTTKPTTTTSTKPTSTPSTTTPATTPTPTTKPTTTPTTPTTPSQSTSASDALLTAPLTAQEQQMVNLVNKERTSIGLNALTVDMRLVKIARMKSLDMINNNYFGHQSPVYGSPFDLMKAQGVTYKTAGENIAGNSSVEAAHTGLMNSPGHRANILNTQYTKIGIGIIKGGPYGYMFTQEFIG